MDCHGREQAETKTPWCVLEELAGCLGTTLQLSAIHSQIRNTQGPQRYLCGVRCTEHREQLTHQGQPDIDHSNNLGRRYSITKVAGHFLGEPPGLCFAPF